MQATTPVFVRNPLVLLYVELPLVAPDLVVVGVANQRELIALAPGPRTLYPPSSLTPKCSAMPIADGRAGGRSARSCRARPRSPHAAVPPRVRARPRKTYP